MIINIRGTHGSGKSTIVREIIHRYEFKMYTEFPTGKKSKILGYRVYIPWLSDPLHVVGSYENACGGCDGIQPYALIWPRVVEYANEGHVLFEGALVSSSYGEIGRASAVYGNQFVFAVMNTPLKVCLDRIAARRKARGDDRPVNPKNTEVKYNNILRSMLKIKEEFGRRVEVIDYRQPIPQVLELLKDG